VRPMRMLWRVRVLGRVLRAADLGAYLGTMIGGRRCEMMVGVAAG
jgi:hypothetical protein